jgi:hypothetical protein
MERLARRKEMAFEKESYLAMAHGNPKESEIPASWVPEPFKEPLPHIMSMAQGIPVRLQVLDLKFLKMVAPALFQSLSKGVERDERSVLLVMVM